MTLRCVMGAGASATGVPVDNLDPTTHASIVKHVKRLHGDDPRKVQALLQDLADATGLATIPRTATSVAVTESSGTEGTSGDGVTSRPIAGDGGSVLTLEAALEEVDRFVDANDLDCSSLGTLSAALTSPFRGEGKIAETRMLRALFRWINCNIDYDFEAFVSGKEPHVQPDLVLEKRKTVCSGYSRLLQALATPAGLTVRCVAGWSKGYGFRVGDTFEGTQTNHEWNIVELGGEPFFCDPTWATGHISNGAFVRKFNEHYWLTRPDQFVFSHLPDPSQEDDVGTPPLLRGSEYSRPERLQLLTPAISQESYSQLVQLKPGFFHAGLHIVSHAQQTITLKAPMAAVELSIPPTSSLMAVLHEGGQAQVALEKRAFVQRDIESGRAIVHARPPGPGKYALRVFARAAEPDEGSSNTYDWACDYAVETSSDEQLGDFPTTFQFMPGEAVLAPLDGTLPQGSVPTFAVRTADGATDVAVITADGQWHHLDSKLGNIFEGGVALKSPGSLQLCVKRSSKDSSYESLAEFTCL